MLAPDIRSVAVDLLRPPPDHHLDLAVLTTYSLDLETLLALPLAVMAQAEQGMDTLLADPLLIVEGLREAGRKLHVFVDRGGMAIPGAQRDLYALLEPCVHPVCAPAGGAFHPKLWAARFINPHGDPLIRVAVLSRNLTFDRSWDLALVSEAPPGRKTVKASKAIAALVAKLPSMAVETVPEDTQRAAHEMAEALKKTAFPAPEGFKGHVEFTALGLSGRKRRKHWTPRPNAQRALAIAPFVSPQPLDWVASLSTDTTLVGRADQLDALKDDPNDAFSQVLVLDDAAHDEDQDDTAARPSGLHAKALVLEHGHDVTWWVGSANLTRAAYFERNVELMAAITGRKGRAGGHSGQGILRFMESGFRTLCTPYIRTPRPTESRALTKARRQLAEARRLLVEAPLTIACRQDEQARWRWRLQGPLTLPETVHAHAWPISRGEAEAAPLQLPLDLPMPRPSLTAFVAFRLSVPGLQLDDERLVRKLPIDGLPEGRVHAVLRDLIQSPERLLRFLRALLGGLDGMLDALDKAPNHATPRSHAQTSDGVSPNSLLEDLVRAASRDPERLNPIRNILQDLQKTDEGRQIIPDGLLETWHAIEAALNNHHGGDRNDDRSHDHNGDHRSRQDRLNNPKIDRNTSTDERDKEHRDEQAAKPGDAHRGEPR